MDETLPGGTEPIAATAGDRLRAAREAAGLSLADVAARTRVPQRQLEAVEQGRYAALPSPTYAIGFAKAYARTVGVDEVEIATAIRADIARVGTRPPEYEPYEVADPARIPSPGLAIVAAGVALAVLILVGLWYGTDLFSGGRSTPAPEPTVAAAPSDTPTAAPSPIASAAPVPTGGQVRITATGRVWLRVYDTDDKTLYLGTMDVGDHFDVPADAKGPMINIGRPDKIQVTLNGRGAPPLGASDHAIKDVKVDGASIAARMMGAATPLPTPTPTPIDAAGLSEPMASPSRPGHGERHARARHRPRDETARANLDSARTSPVAATPTP